MVRSRPYCFKEQDLQGMQFNGEFGETNNPGVRDPSDQLFLALAFKDHVAGRVC